jgi:hypothetical protein
MPRHKVECIEKAGLFLMPCFIFPLEMWNICRRRKGRGTLLSRIPLCGGNYRVHIRADEFWVLSYVKGERISQQVPQWTNLMVSVQPAALSKEELP